MSKKSTLGIGFPKIFSIRSKHYPLTNAGTIAMNCLAVLTQKTAIYSINAYQSHISPKKGFSCPHRLLYGGSSCSDHVKDLLLHQDLSEVIGMTRQRFQSCVRASQQLQQSGSSGGCIVIPCCVPI